MATSQRVEALRSAWGSSVHSSLIQKLIKEMADEWRAGRRPRAEEFLNQHPFLWDQPEVALELLYEEICQRVQRDDAACWDDLLERFPQWKEQLQVLFDCHRIVGSVAGPPVFPEVGESLGEFHLIAEVGHGAQGRVFLAQQGSLADRPVILKVTGRAGDEHLLLARLQHTHIVPLYSVLDVPERNLRALCMPYFGGATLQQLLSKIRAGSTSWNGKHLVEALVKTDPHWIEPGARAPARQFLRRASQAQAVCWVGVCLADALKYAHDRGLLHLDIKPSNVLLAADAQPMLLDFHLAQQPLAAGSQDVLRVGGTPGYMAPEHEAALEATRHGQPVPTAVDGRADIYSLGATLYEVLAGAPHKHGSPRIDRANPSVSPGLADIIHRCLAPEAAQRYADADQLSTDFRRHLNDLPLVGVANRSLSERWRKWRRRRPHLLAVHSLLAIVIFVAVVGLTIAASHLQQSVHESRRDLQQSESLTREGRYDDAATRAKTGQARIQGLPGTSMLQTRLIASLRRAQQLKSERQLHDLTNQLRALYDVDWIARKNLAGLHDRCKELWKQRQMLVAAVPGHETRRAAKVKADLLDVAILTAALEVRLAEDDEIKGARQSALGLLKEAELEFGQSPALAYEQYLHERDAGLSERGATAPDLQAQGAVAGWDRYALGRAMLREGRFQEASVNFQQALSTEPQDLWPNFYEGICAYRLKRYLEAIVAFTACVAQAPQMPEAFYNRALTYAALGQGDRALADYGRALQLRPDFAAAAYNRGLLHYRAKDRQAAIADFERAVTLGFDPALLPPEVANSR